MGILHQLKLWFNLKTILQILKLIDNSEITNPISLLQTKLTENDILEMQEDTFSTNDQCDEHVQVSLNLSIPYILITFCDIENRSTKTALEVRMTQFPLFLFS